MESEESPSHPNPLPPGDRENPPEPGFGADDTRGGDLFQSDWN